MESDKDKKDENNFLECPYCTCNFVSQFDLQSHLEAFGSNKYEHITQLDNAHKSVDRTYGKGSLSKGSKNVSRSKPKSRYYQY